MRVLILTGAGKAFCAGLDLKELGSGQAALGGGENGVTARDPVAALARFSGPVIGAINGAAVTGGFELALACDVLLASPQARFADTHARVGIAPGWGLSQRLSRAIGIYRAREISLTGNWVSAEQAAAWGFVNRVVPAEELLACRAPAGHRHAELRAGRCCRATRPSSTTASRWPSATACSWKRRAAASSMPASAPRPSRRGAKQVRARNRG